MKTILFLSVSIDGFIADQQGIPSFPAGAWEDRCSLVNETNSLIAGRSSYEQVVNDEAGALLTPQHKVVLSSKDLKPADTSWQHAKSPAEALEILRNKGVNEAIIGGGRAVALSFIREQLIDSIVVDLQPVAFGAGTPMFGDVMAMVQLRFIDSRTLDNGAMRLHYEVLLDKV